MARLRILLLALLGSLAFGQDLTLNVGDLYLPMLAETVECGTEKLVDFGFSERDVELLEIFVMPEDDESLLKRTCYLFRDVRAAEARTLVATILRDLAARGYWHGIPGDFGGLNLIQGAMDRTLVAFSFLKEEGVLGPHGGVAGFDLDHDDGLVLHLWARYVNPY